jgi:hypothetical protein
VAGGSWRWRGRREGRVATELRREDITEQRVALACLES